MSDVTFGLVYEAEAEVVTSDHVQECVAAHPNQPCPGYPHTDTDAQEG